MADKLKILIVGVGNMGQNHLRALLTRKDLGKVVVCDRSPDVLDRLKSAYAKTIGDRIEFFNVAGLEEASNGCAGAVIATTANNRSQTVDTILKGGVKQLLIEKPVEQSIEKFDEIASNVKKQNAAAHVNLTFHAIEQYRDFYHWIKEAEQFNGKKQIHLSGGAIGIGANACHFLDIIANYTGASRYKIQSATIDETRIPSGRGEEFIDFGGTAHIQLLDDHDEEVAELFASLNAESTAQALVSIIGAHGRLDFDHKQRTYSYSIRKTGSDLPVNKVYGDYETKTGTYKPFDGTAGLNEWMKVFSGEKVNLPELKDTRMVHEMVYEWLSHGKGIDSPYPIT